MPDEHDRRTRIVIVYFLRSRAIETARVLQEGGLGGQLIVDERLAPGNSWTELALALADHPGAKEVLFVGHQPTLSQSMELLTGAGAIELREGGLGRVEFRGAVRPAAGALTLLLDPALYLSLAGPEREPQPPGSRPNMEGAP